MTARFYAKDEADWVEITTPSGDTVSDAVERIKRERPAEWAELEAAYNAWADAEDAAAEAAEKPAKAGNDKAAAPKAKK